MALAITIEECPHCKQPIPPKLPISGVNYVDRTICDVRVQPAEWRLFNIFADRFGRDVPMDVIQDLMWSQSLDGGPLVAKQEIRVLVCKLRQKLVTIGYTILPARGVGYRLTRRHI